MKDRPTYDAWMRLLEIHGERKRTGSPYPVPSLTVFRQLVQEGRWREAAAKKWPGDEEIAAVGMINVEQSEG